MKRYQLDADPERAAYLDAVLDAEIAAALRTTRRPQIVGGRTESSDCSTDAASEHAGDATTGADTGGAAASTSRSASTIDDNTSGSVIEDTRTPAQIGADVLTDMARHVLGCENTTHALATTTVVVRMTLDQLHTGHGAAQIGPSINPRPIH